MPRVSVLTPCHNAEPFIGPAIESVRRQTFRDWEHIVVDDGSTDRSAEVVKSFAAEDPRIRLISQSNHGVAHARNQAFKASAPSSRYLLFLDADDSLEPEMLSVLVDYLETHPDVGLARSEYRFINEKGEEIEDPESKERYVPAGLWVRKLLREEAETPFLSVFTLAAVIPSVALIRRSVFAETPGFDESFGHHHEDADLFFHVALRSKVHFIPRVLVRRRRHPGQNTAACKEFREFARGQQKKLYTKWLSQNGLTLDQKALVREAWKFREGRLEPFFAFRRSRECLTRGEVVRAARNFAGGMRRYIGSFIPGMIKDGD